MAKPRKTPKLQRAPTPFDGAPGLWAKVNRFLYPHIGPAQLGAGYDEGPVRAAVDPLCPVCSKPLAEHRVQRGEGTRTFLNCP